MIEVEDLVKRYGTVTAVDGMTFTVEPGRVTGFLGPNGAGKSTTMRMILGLDTPTSGTARVNGHPYRHAQAPIAELGALLDGKAVDKTRSARNHLRAVGATVGIGRHRVEEVLELVGLSTVADTSAGQFSLGMGQRLGIATALLADPAILMLDEPANGLDPDGILWIRELLRDLADEGRTVFLSSHLMSEMELTADHLIVVGRGRVLADESMSAFIGRATGASVLVASPQAAELSMLLTGPGITVSTTDRQDQLEVTGLDAAAIGALAAHHAITLHQLATRQVSLEEAFMELTADSVAFHGSATHTATAA